MNFFGRSSVKFTNKSRNHGQGREGLIKVRVRILVSVRIVNNLGSVDHRDRTGALSRKT